MTLNYSAVKNRKILQSRRNFKNMELVCGVRRVLTTCIVTRRDKEEEAVGGGTRKEGTIY
jgi:hypothetical protein